MAGPIYNDATNRVLGYGAPQALSWASTVTIDPSTDNAGGGYFTLVMGGNTTFAAFNNPSGGNEFLLELQQDGTGSRTATWNANVSWAGGTAPTLTTTANATDIISFTWNPNAGKWRGFLVGKAFS